MIYNHTATGRLEVRIKINGVSTYLGLVDTKEEGEIMLAGARKAIKALG